MANAKSKPAIKPQTDKAPDAPAAPKTSPKRTQAVSVDQVMARSEEFTAMVAEAAYYRAEARGFAPGYEQDDWLAAEADIVAAITQPK